MDDFTLVDVLLRTRKLIVGIFSFLNRTLAWGDHCYRITFLSLIGFSFSFPKWFNSVKQMCYFNNIEAKLGFVKKKEAKQGVSDPHLGLTPTWLGQSLDVA